MCTITACVLRSLPSPLPAIEEREEAEEQTVKQGTE